MQYYIQLQKLCFNLIPLLQRLRNQREAFLFGVAAALFLNLQITNKVCEQLYHPLGSFLSAELLLWVCSYTRK